ncbi:MAG: hypothetical protein ACJ8LG_21690 [Massilia sp.]
MMQLKPAHILCLGVGLFLAARYLSSRMSGTGLNRGFAADPSGSGYQT